MRVILVTGEIPPHPGGIGNYTAQLARKLAETGLNTTVLAVDSPLDSTLERDPGYNLVRLSKPWGRTANNWIRKLVGLDECTWVHVQYQTGAFKMNPGINLATRGWQKRGLRVAWTYHDLLPPYLFPKIGKRARDWVTLRPARFSQAVISTNPGDCARLQAAGFPAWEIPIPSLLPVNTSTAKELSAIRKSYGVPSEDLLLGHVGLALPGKGVQTLVESLRELRRRGESAQLLLIGGTSDRRDQSNPGFRAGLLRQIEMSGMQDYVTWTGYLDNSETSAAIACCDLMVMPFTAGASARNSSLMACLAQGSVTITTTPQESGLLPDELPTVPPHDHMKLADVIQETFSSAELQEKARQAAAVVTQGRTWDVVIRQHLRIYETYDQQSRT